MPPPPPPPAASLTDLEGLVKRITDAYGKLAQSQQDLAAKMTAQEVLVSAAKDLVTAAQVPYEAVRSLLWSNAFHPCLITAANCGLLKEWPSKEMNADQLAEMTGAEKRLIVRIMRVLNVTGVFKEIGEETYSHNFMSTALSNPSIQTTLKFTAPALTKIPDYLALTSYRNPGYSDETASLFQFANETPLSFYQALSSSEAVRRGFDGAMAGHIAAERQQFRSGFASLWDFEGQISPLIKDATDVAIVDIGGSRGHVLEDVRRFLPGLKGRLILEELPSTLAGLTLPDGLEAVPYNFLEQEQPIKDTVNSITRAAVYLFRQIFLNWSERRGREILLNTLPAMTKGKSKLLIMEPVLPPTGAPYQSTMLDIQMMQMSGGLRTQKQWREFLDECGFEVKKFWPSRSSQTIIEAIPKSSS